MVAVNAVDVEDVVAVDVVVAINGVAINAVFGADAAAAFLALAC